MQAVTSKRATHIVLFLGVIILFSLVGMATINAVFSVADEIYNGVKIGDIDVGGLSAAEAGKKLTAAFQERVRQAPVTLIFRDQQWTITTQEIDLAFDAAAAVRQAYAVGRTGNFFYQLKEKYLAINQGYVIPMTLSYDSVKLQAAVSKVAAMIDRDPKNASLTVAKSDVTISPEIVGYKVDVAKTMTELSAQLGVKIPVTVQLPVTEIAPKITARDLQGIDGIIASYSTQFDASSQNRTENIALAAKSINGVLVKQGAVFSFNEHVGLRLAEKGYKVAPVFINGKLLPDWGGGVCQVSSTLYNTVLLANMEIEERTAHFRPPGYVPLGQDATVADNQLDFKFKNTSTHNIYITSEVFGNQVTVSIFGKLSSDPVDIVIVGNDKKVMEPNTIIKQDPQLDFGEEVVEVEGQKGFQITTFRVKYRNGKEIGREFLATDEFPAEDRVMRVGTKTPAKIKK